jgi:hypothetical protein
MERNSLSRLSIKIFEGSFSSCSREEGKQTFEFIEFRLKAIDNEKVISFYENFERKSVGYTGVIEDEDGLVSMKYRKELVSTKVK